MNALAKEIMNGFQPIHEVAETEENHDKPRKMSVDELLGEDREDLISTSQRPNRKKKLIMRLSALQHELDDWTLKNEETDRKYCEKVAVLENVEQQIQHKRSTLRSTEESIRHFKKAHPLDRLEKNVEQINQTNDEMRVHLQSIRHEVDNLRREKMMLTNSCNTDLNLLATKEKLLSVVLEETEKAYHEKVAADKQYKHTKQILDNERMKLRVQLRGIQDIVDGDTRIKNVLSPKKRSNKASMKQQAAERKLSELQTRKASIVGIKGMENLLRQKVNQKAWKFAKTKAVEAVSRTKTLSFEEAFEKSKSFMKSSQKCNNLTDLCNNIVEVEKCNNELRSNLQEEQENMNILMDKIESSQSEIAKYRQMGIDTERKQETILGNMQNKVALLDEEYATLTTGLKKRDYLYNEVTSEVAHIFKRLGCKNSKLVHGFDRKMDCMQLLGVIEEQLLHLLKIIGVDESVDLKCSNSITSDQELVSQQIQHLSLQIGNDDDPQDSQKSSDVKAKPLVGSELRVKVKDIVSKFA